MPGTSLSRLAIKLLTRRAVQVQLIARSFITQGRLQQQQQTTVFDKKLRIKYLNRSASNKDAHIYDYVRDHVAKDVCDRVDDLIQSGKRLVFSLGSCSGLIARNLNPNSVEALIEGDVSRANLDRSKCLNAVLPLSFPTQHIVCDEEHIPIKRNSIDLAISCMNLHGVNDLVSCFKQVHEILKDDRAFIGALLGGDTLYELRSSLQLAELERLSGFSSHIAPKTTGQDIARLLQANGFQLVTVDISDIRINYPSIFELMFDLQGMGESNTSLLGCRHMHRDVLQASAAIYQSLYGGENSEEGVPATFQVIHFIGWKNPSKANPLRNE